MIRNRTAEMLLTIIIVVFLLWLYRPLLLSPGVPTGGDEIFYAWMSDESKRRTIDFHNPWIGGPTEYYLYLWYDLIINNSFSFIFKEKFPIFIVIFFSIAASLSFFEVVCYILQEVRVKVTLLVKFIILLMALLFVFSGSSGSVLENGFSVYLSSLGSSIGFLVIIVPPLWSFIAFNALKISNMEKKIILYTLLHLFSLISLCNPAGYVVVMSMYVLLFLSLFMNAKIVSNMSTKYTIDYLILLANMTLFSLYSILPTYVAMKLGSLGHLEFYFDPRIIERLNMFSSNFLQSIFLINKVSLFPLSIVLALFFGFSLTIFKKLIQERTSNVFFLYLILLFLFGSFISTGGFTPYDNLSNKLYLLLFSIGKGELSKPHKFDGLFYFPYMLFCTVGLALFIDKLQRFSSRIVKRITFFIILGIEFLLLIETFQGLFFIFEQHTYALYSPLIISNDLLNINKLLKNEAEARVLILPTCFEWIWRPPAKTSGYIAQYPYEILWNLRYLYFPFTFYKWRDILSEKSHSQEVMLPLLKTFNVNFIVVSKELLKSIEPKSSYETWINTTLKIEHSIKNKGVLIYSGKDYNVYYLGTNYAQPVSLIYDQKYVFQDYVEMLLEDAYLFYYNSTHVVPLSIPYTNNVLKNDEIDKVKIESTKLFLAGSLAIINLKVPDDLLNKTLFLHVGDVYNTGFLNIAFHKRGVSTLHSFPTLSNATILSVPIESNHITILRLYIPSLVWIIVTLLNISYFVFCLLDFKTLKKY
jgi:hypothetical protein